MWGKKYVDDIIVFGASQQEHDLNLERVLQRLEEKGITLNQNKCEFRKSEISFFGCMFSKDGLRPDPKKIEAIQKTKAPKSVGEIKSFLWDDKLHVTFYP